MDGRNGEGRGGGGRQKNMISKLYQRNNPVRFLLLSSRGAIEGRDTQLHREGEGGSYNRAFVQTFLFINLFVTGIYFAIITLFTSLFA